jgi:DNA-binding CsgD family transcriptional regulator
MKNRHSQSFLATPLLDIHLFKPRFLCCYMLPMLRFPSKPALDFLAATYRLQDLDSLASTILLELPSLIPCDNVMIGSHDGTRRVMTGIVLRTPFTHSQFLAEANQTGLMGLHPFWDRMLDSNQPLKVLSEMSPGRRWLENPIYHDVLREDRVRDHLNVEFGSSISNFTSVSVIRSTVGFRRSERETLQLLLPHLAQAFSNAHLVDRNGISTKASESTHTSAIPIAQDGAWLDRAAHERIRTVLGQSGHPIDRLDRWLTLSLDQLNRGSPAVAHLQLRHGSQSSMFHLQRDWLHRRYRLLHRLTSGPGELLGQPLSKKEREIAFWIAEGKTNAEIATLAGTSPETVKSHLKRMFRKLGVESRTALANHTIGNLP